MSITLVKSIGIKLITCLVCNRHGNAYTDLRKNNWQLAKNRIGGYVCSNECANIIELYDKSLKIKK